MARQCSCGYEVGDYDVLCSRCGAALPRATGGENTPATRDIGAPPSKPVMSRYSDAYRVAGALAAIGNVLKLVGFVGAVLVGVLSAIYLPPEARAAGLVFGLIIAGIWFAVFFVSGLIISAQGQLLQATLDGSVNTSPFLTNEQRSEVMGLI